jgi:hypothetical protein
MTFAHISIINEQMKVGCTAPLRAVTDDGRDVILKTFNNCEGNRILFNEWVAYQLAVKIDLPIPIAFWGTIDKNTQLSGMIDQSKLGICFCSSLLRKATPILPTVVKLITNIDSIAPVILFDHLIYNADRNPGNLLMDMLNRRFVVFDHSHVFAETAEWSRYSLNEINDIDMATDYSIMRENACTYNMFFQHKSKNVLGFRDIVESKFCLFNRSDIHDIIYGTPIEVRPSLDDCEALEDFLVKRTRHCMDFCQAILDC